MNPLLEDLAEARRAAITRMFLNLVADGSSPGTLDRGKRGLALITEIHDALAEHVKESQGKSK